MGLCSSNRKSPVHMVLHKAPLLVPLDLFSCLCRRANIWTDSGLQGDSQAGCSTGQSWCMHLFLFTFERMCIHIINLCWLGVMNTNMARWDWSCLSGTLLYPPLVFITFIIYLHGVGVHHAMHMLIRGQIPVVSSFLLPFVILGMKLR